MGRPISSIKLFENDVKSSFKQFEKNSKHSYQNWSIILLVNAESDTDAANFIIRNFHQMDIISDDVDFYIPGFVNRELDIHDIKHENQMAKEMYPDFHAKIDDEPHYFMRPIGWSPSKHLSHCKIIGSSRHRDIIFNIAEFADFVLQLTRKIEGYHYLGDAQMIIVSSNNGTIAYNNSGIYELYPLTTCRNLDRFFHKVIQIIREDMRDLDFSPLKILQGLGTKSVIAKIDEVYESLIKDSTSSSIGHQEIAVENLIHKMNNRCNYSLVDGDFYFLSYSDKDSIFALELKRALENVGINVWMAPYCIPANSCYAAVIPTAIKLARNFLVLLSPDSFMSEDVRSEIAIAKRNAIRTKTKILLKGISVDDVLHDNELEYLIGRIHMGYTYKEVIEDKSTLLTFLND